ncbi:MAG TPA: hypothetical protein VFU23_13180 [Gemmatimonadales bacterium]|nr:hypothetical protein [Gemmatimonadales bacterium]
MGTSDKHDLLREGILIGAVGAIVVAGWFLVTDLLQGRPLSTPSVLGQVILYGITDPVVSPPALGPVVAYTLLHFGAFALFGVAVTQMIHLSMSSALARFGLMITAVVFELFFFMVTYALFTATSFLFPWWSVLAANTLSLLAMSIVTLRAHPGLREQFSLEPLGDAPAGDR